MSRHSKAREHLPFVAPTGDAVAKLPEGPDDDLLKTDNIEKPNSILTCHVGQGKAMAADAVKLDAAPNVSGKSFSISQKDGAVFADL